MQSLKFCKELKNLGEHFSIVNKTTSYDYLEIIGLITRLVQQLMKKGLCKYGLQKGACTCDSNLHAIVGSGISMQQMIFV
jgi:hypothetical protein